MDVEIISLVNFGKFYEVGIAWRVGKMSSKGIS